MRSLITAAVFSLVAFVAPVQLLGVENTKGKEPLTVSNGNKVTLTDYLVPGKYTIFDFYSDYCPPCRALKPRLEHLHAARENIALVVVNINRPGVRGIDWKSPVAGQYDLHSIPHLVIYDSSGKIVAEDHSGDPAARKFIEKHWSD